LDQKPEMIWSCLMLNQLFKLCNLQQHMFVVCQWLIMNYLICSIKIPNLKIKKFYQEILSDSLVW